MTFAATWVDLEIIILSEVKSDRERQLSYDITYMWDLKKMIQMNLFRKQKQTHRRRKQTYAYQRGQQGRGGEKQGDVDESVQTSSYKMNKF